MRTIYLIRHGEPEFPDGRRLCIGTTDLPLSAKGKMQAALAGESLRPAPPEAVYASPLRRSLQTAEALGRPVTAVTGFREAYFGAWEGLSFDEIRARWPELYGRRGADPGLLPPGSESFERLARRFGTALDAALASSQGTVAVVTHSAVLKTFLGGVQGLPPARFMQLSLPYGSVTELGAGDGFRIRSLGKTPRPKLTHSLCCTLLDCAGLPDRVKAHCRAVAAQADVIGDALRLAGLDLDAEFIHSCALLHDVSRPRPAHAEAGADLLAALGYPAHAAVIRRHMELGGFDRIDEAAVVFIADKQVREDRRATLAERYAAGADRRLSPEARAAYDRRKKEAENVAAAVNKICGRELIT
jgi:broad specificity phosphatase PhoE